MQLLERVVKVIFNSAVVIGQLVAEVRRDLSGQAVRTILPMGRRFLKNLWTLENENGKQKI